MKRYYVVCPNSELRQLCIDNNWFTQGSIRQYDKLFDLNSSDKAHRWDEDTAVIIAIIWVCSNASKEDIERIVLEKQYEYCTELFKMNELERMNEYEEIQI